ncbi:MAG: hypothetical protein HC794_10000 [Nitrospiraceae bacterium]|nr:hypothetical protein [Nitrospiraceae bacterium]
MRRSFWTCELALSLARSEASGVSVLFRQLDEDDDPGIRLIVKVPVPFSLFSPDGSNST